MTITPELQHALEQAGDSPVELTDPRTNTSYVLVRSDLYHEMRELLEDERAREVLTKMAKRNATARMEEP